MGKWRIQHWKNKMCNSNENANRKSKRLGALSFDYMITAPFFFVLLFVSFNLVMQYTVQADMNKEIMTEMRNIGTQNSAYDAYISYYNDFIDNGSATEPLKVESYYSCFKIREAIEMPLKDVDYQNISLSKYETVETNSSPLLNSKSISPSISESSFNTKYESLWNRKNIIEITVTKQFSNVNTSLATGVTINGHYYSFIKSTVTKVFYYNIENAN